MNTSPEYLLLFPKFYSSIYSIICNEHKEELIRRIKKLSEIVIDEINKSCTPESVVAALLRFNQLIPHYRSLKKDFYDLPALVDYDEFFSLANYYDKNLSKKDVIIHIENIEKALET